MPVDEREQPSERLLPPEARNYLLWRLERAQQDLLDLERDQAARQLLQQPPADLLSGAPAVDLNAAANKKRLEIKSLRAQLGLGL